jgi:hypothetical protein
MRTSGFSEEAAKEAKGNLLPAGPRQAGLRGMESRRSKAGNDMLVARWSIHDGEGDVEILDYLTDAKRNALRLRHLAAAFGVLDKYESGSLEASDFTLGRMVTAQVVIEKATRMYPAKNAIEDYSTAA